MNHLNIPHGGKLCNLLVDKNIRSQLQLEALHYPSHTLTDRQLCDVELLLNGSFSPLTGFLGEEDYQSVLQDLRLKDGTLWPIPVTLDVKTEFAINISQGEKIALRDHEGVLIAVMTVSDIWKPDKKAEAEKVFGT
ncbi:MAG: adenylyltransferase, partial [Candidatus Marinimicrobia bacterium]|nr:adenylyltransferase [Candidatus Neomarinimicrobiota bacterium]